MPRTANTLPHTPLVVLGPASNSFSLDRARPRDGCAHCCRIVATTSPDTLAVFRSYVRHIARPPSAPPHSSMSRTSGRPCGGHAPVVWWLCALLCVCACCSHPLSALAEQVIGNSTLWPLRLPSACRVASDDGSWTTPSRGVLRPLIALPSCELVSLNLTLPDGGWTLQSHDTRNGSRVWQWPLLNADGSQALPALGTAVWQSVTSPERLYVATMDPQGDPSCQTITAVRYGAVWPSGALWTVSTCINDSSEVAAANVLRFEFSGGHEVVLVLEPYFDLTGSRWTAFDGSSGLVLHQEVNVPLLSEVVYQLGDPSNAQFAVWSEGERSETLHAYSIDSDGAWHLQLDPPLHWNTTKLSWVINSNSGKFPTIIPPIVALSPAETDSSRWLGYDVRTGKQVWAYDCKLCLAASIRAAYPTLDNYGWAFTASAVNSSQVLFITALAYNSSRSGPYAFASQYGLFDAVAGKMLAQSAIGPVQWALIWPPPVSMHLGAIDDSVLIAETSRVDGAIVWRALSASNLEQLGSGVLPSVVDSATGGQHLYLSVDQHNATIMYVTNQDINGHNPIRAITVRVGGREDASTSWQQPQHRSSARLRSDKASAAPAHTPTGAPIRYRDGHQPRSIIRE